MSKTVWKYQLERNHTELALPRGAEVLSIQPLESGVFLWALVDPTEEAQEPRVFISAWTGDVLSDQPMRYYTTFVRGGLVWHAFEVLLEPQCLPSSS